MEHDTMLVVIDNDLIVDATQVCAIESQGDGTTTWTELTLRNGKALRTTCSIDKVLEKLAHGLGTPVAGLD